VLAAVTAEKLAVLVEHFQEELLLKLAQKLLQLAHLILLQYR
jgi:hypothetical protein